MRSIVRRDTSESYVAYLKKLAEEAGIDPEDGEAVRRMDRKRKKRTSNKDWVNPHDPDAEVTKMKDGATHLAYKAEQAVDLDTGAIVAITTQGGATGDTASVSAHYVRPVFRSAQSQRRRPMVAREPSGRKAGDRQAITAAQSARWPSWVRTYISELKKAAASEQ
jgi:hypothetical protein